MNIGGIALGAYSIGFRYGLRSVLDEVSFEIKRGEFLAILGPNGSGKTTLLKVVSGILPIDQKRSTGQVKYLGQDFLSLTTARRAQSVAYVGSELRSEFPMTALEAVGLARSSQGFRMLEATSSDDREKVSWAMHKCRCWELRDRLVDTLSGGERQLVLLARALAQGAKVLLMDETLSRMDLNHQFEIGKMLRELVRESWSVILVSHDVNLALEWADSGLWIHQGRKIAHGPIDAVMTQERMSAVYPGAGLWVGKSPKSDRPKVFFDWEGK